MEILLMFYSAVAFGVFFGLLLSKINEWPDMPWVIYSAMLTLALGWPAILIGVIYYGAKGLLREFCGVWEW
jgi:hypothetical protein